MKIAIHLPDGSQVCTKKQIIFTYEIEIAISMPKSNILNFVIFSKSLWALVVKYTGFIFLSNF